MMGGEDGNAPSSSVLISGSVCTFHIVCNRWGSSGMQVIVSMLHWWNDIEFPSQSSSIFLPGSSPLGLPCLAWDQPGYVRWCVDGDGDVMNVDPLIMTFGVAHGEMGKFVKLNCISHLLSSDFQRVRRQSCPFSLLYQIQYVVLHRWSLIVSFGTGATSSSY